MQQVPVEEQAETLDLRICAEVGEITDSREIEDSVMFYIGGEANLRALLLRAADGRNGISRKCAFILYLGFEASSKLAEGIPSSFSVPISSPYPENLQNDSVSDYSLSGPKFKLTFVESTSGKRRLPVRRDTLLLQYSIECTVLAKSRPEKSIMSGAENELSKKKSSQVKITMCNKR
jgi:hypothetical protein